MVICGDKHNRSAITLQFSATSIYKYIYLFIYFKYHELFG